MELVSRPGWIVVADDGTKVEARWLPPGDGREIVDLRGRRDIPNQWHAFLAVSGQEDDRLLDSGLGLSEAGACATVDRWIDNLALGRGWWMSRLRPREMGDFYTDRRWEPEGARLHVLLVPEVGPQLTETYGLVMHAWQHALRPVPAHQVHATLSWLRAPVAAGITTETRQQVADELRTRFADLDPISTLADRTVEPARVRSYGVRCEIPEDDKSTGGRLIYAYAAAATAALRAVFGADQVPDPRPDAHLALAYGTGGDIARLHGDLRVLEPYRSDWPVLGDCRILLADADTFATPATEWDRSINLTG
ncbi:hypothetical protein GCM10027059_12440 [Myceligenerans halotolerans]